MAGKTAFRNPVPLSDLAGDILDPVLRRRAGISTGLLQSWEEIVGSELADCTRPERVAWPRRRNEDDPFEPATLVVACQGAVALRLQHQMSEVIARINAFLGFVAIARIRIVQKPVTVTPPRRAWRPRPLTAPEKARLERLTGGIEDEGLRAALDRLGASVLARRG